MPIDISASINRLLRGIATDSAVTVRRAWRELLDNAEQAVPVVLAKLNTKTWNQPPRGPAGKYLGVLLVLLNELDPELFRKEITRLRAKPLDTLHRRTVDLMAKRIVEAPAGHLDGQIPIYIATDIQDPKVVLKYLDRWSRTPGLGTKGVTRIDVIADHPELDFRGLYRIFFGAIVLTWRNEALWGLKLWWQRMIHERTFYHEVGHHACGHTEGGQVEEQEYEANVYAYEMLQKAHPILLVTGRILLFPLYLQRRKKKDAHKPSRGS